jgi:hypothetical protein
MIFNGFASLELELNRAMAKEVFPALVEPPVTNGALVSEERGAQVASEEKDGQVASEEAKAALASEERDGQVTSQETDAQVASEETKAVAKRFRPRLPVIFYRLKTRSRLKVVREVP